MMPKKSLDASRGSVFLKRLCKSQLTLTAWPEKLSHPDAEALIAAAIDQAKVRLPPKARCRLLIRSVVVK
jgi:hypothetical protein